MKTIVGLMGSLPVLLAGMSISSGAFAQDEQAPPPEAAPPATESAPAPPAAPPAAGVQTQGQWVYTDQYGWIWVPAGSEATQDCTHAASRHIDAQMRMKKQSQSRLHAAL